MPTIGDVIQRLMPTGTKGPPATWADCPDWPPDLFAVVATLVELSGCYAPPNCTPGGDPVYGDAYRRRVRAAGRAWERLVFPPPARARRLWGELVGRWDADVTAARRDWSAAALELLAIADEACAGVGFVHEDAASGVFDTVVLAEHANLVAGRPPQYLPDVYRSICMRVPPHEACVQPKSRTAQVGCTLRSCTHHLALLPPVGVVECVWQQMPRGARRRGALRLLVVPYPYRVDTDAFRPGRLIRDSGSGSREFGLVQSWLPTGSPRVQARLIVQFLLELLAEARRGGEPVHGIVLPEVALTTPLARDVARRLAGEPGLELFVSGVVCHEKGKAPRNEAYSTLFFGRQMLEWSQSKHHRWRIEAGQVDRYQLWSLGECARPARFWWEGIDISRRRVFLHVFRPGATLAVLVCEDLARHDPVQPVLRAIGPNLVIALLMDGAQLMSRWPGQYATVLSDDPGCSVLTVTSLGMVRRSVPPGSARPMPIALWRQPWRRPGDDPRELALTQGGHALLLTLDTVAEKNWTLDGRGDQGSTVGLDLKEVREISHPGPPSWL